MILCDICLCLTSLSMIISRSIYVVKMALFHCFLWLSNIPLYIYIYIDTLYIYTHTHTIYIYIYIYINVYTPHLFIHSSISGHLLCFHVLAIVSSAAVNIEVHVYFRIMEWDYWITKQLYILFFKQSP